MENSGKNKRIEKNTLYMYFRKLFSVESRLIHYAMLPMLSQMEVRIINGWFCSHHLRRAEGREWIQLSIGKNFNSLYV